MVFNCIVHEDGIIDALPDKTNFFEFYCELYKSIEANNPMASDYIEKYQCITSVFQKAWITGYRNSDAYSKQIRFKFEFTIGSPFALSLNYQQMEKTVLKVSSNLLQEYIRALYNAKSLYKSLSSTLMDVSKHKTHIESNSVAFVGVTPAQKVAISLEGELNFAIGNYIAVDEFSEFCFGIKEQIKTLIHQVSVQTKPRANDFDGLHMFKERDIFLDSVEFFCLVSYFNQKEIKAIFNNIDIEKLEFKDMDVICTNIKNLIEYYSAKSVSKDYITKAFFERKIGNCLAVFEYVKLPLEVVEYIARFVIKFPTIVFSEVNISDVYLFFNSQIVKYKTTSKKLRHMILDLVLFFLKKEREAFDKGDKFQLPSNVSGINDPCLVHFLINRDDKTITYPRLSMAVEDIFSYNSTYDSYSLLQFYSYVKKDVQKKIEVNISDRLQNKFNIINFEILLNIQKRKICNELISKLVKYMKNQLELIDSGEIEFNSPHNTTQELVIIAEYSIMGWIKTEALFDLCGYEEKFDFLLKPLNYDSNKIQVQWLLDLRKTTETYLCSLPGLKKHIKDKLFDSLRNKTIDTDSFIKLINIYGI